MLVNVPRSVVIQKTEVLEEHVAVLLRPGNRFKNVSCRDPVPLAITFHDKAGSKANLDLLLRIPIDIAAPCEEAQSNQILSKHTHDFDLFCIRFLGKHESLWRRDHSSSLQ